jgi:hypothetical protein
MRITVLSIVVCVAAVGQAAPGGAAMAQTSTTPAPGTRVRVTAPGVLTPEVQSGRLISFRSDSLLLQPDGGETSLAVPRASVTELDVSEGLHTRTRRGLAIGLLVGAGAGAGIGAATYTRPTCKNLNLAQCIGVGIGDPGRGGVALISGVLGGIAGLVVGGLIGHAHTSEQWERVEGSRASLFRFVPDNVSIAPSGLGIALSMRI